MQHAEAAGTPGETPPELVTLPHNHLKLYGTGSGKSTLSHAAVSRPIVLTSRCSTKHGPSRSPQPKETCSV
jgi:hypothetical protein